MMVKSSCMLSDNNPMIVSDSDTTIQMATYSMRATFSGSSLSKS